MSVVATWYDSRYNNGPKELFLADWYAISSLVPMHAPFPKVTFDLLEKVGTGAALPHTQTPPQEGVLGHHDAITAQ